MIYAQRIVLLVLLFATISCESQEDRRERLAREEAARQQRAEALRLQRMEDSITEVQLRIERERHEAEEAAARAAELERQRKAQEERNRYINNSLYTGSTPYAYCYGGNSTCEDWGCSELEVVTPSNSDVVVTIKKAGDVVRHAYIRRGSRYKFELPNGTYQPYFYYGVGWNPNKVMKRVACGELKGGFIESEHFGKDDPQSLINSILTYELILQQGGNFATRPSNAAEAF